jgi:hypothetical protein
MRSAPAPLGPCQRVLALGPSARSRLEDRKAHTPRLDGFIKNLVVEKRRRGLVDEDRRVP